LFLFVSFSFTLTSAISALCQTTCPLFDPKKDVPHCSINQDVLRPDEYRINSNRREGKSHISFHVFPHFSFYGSLSSVRLTRGFHCDLHLTVGSLAAQWNWRPKQIRPQKT